MASERQSDLGPAARSAYGALQAVRPRFTLPTEIAPVANPGELTPWAGEGGRVVYNPRDFPPPPTGYAGRALFNSFTGLPRYPIPPRLIDPVTEAGAYKYNPETEMLDPGFEDIPPEEDEWEEHAQPQEIDEADEAEAGPARPLTLGEIESLIGTADPEGRALIQRMQAVWEMLRTRGMFGPQAPARMQAVREMLGPQEPE